MSRQDLFTPSLVENLSRTAREAGELIMSFYRGGHEVHRKDDASPVTQADRDADKLIVAALRNYMPGVAIVSEEGEKPGVTGHDYFWLVDPLDGTKSFIRGKGYFTVNIGLIEHGRPVMGIVYDPASKVLYTGFKGQALRDGAPIRVREATPGREVALISHSHINQATQDYLNTHGIEERMPCESSIKFCFLAEGKADLYPRFGPTMEWDTAAGHAVLAAAGGKVVNPDGTPFLYGKEGFLNGNFIASGK